MSLALFFAQHVSNASTFIFRSLRLCVSILLCKDSYLVLASLFSGECLVMGFLVCSVF